MEKANWKSFGDYKERKYLITRKVPKGFRKTGVSGIKTSVLRYANAEKCNKVVLYPLRKGKYIREMRYRLHVPRDMTWI